jgi:hypothetical protein
MWKKTKPKLIEKSVRLIKEVRLSRSYKQDGSGVYNVKENIDYIVEVSNLFDDGSIDIDEHLTVETEVEAILTYEFFLKSKGSRSELTQIKEQIIKL